MNGSERYNSIIAERIRAIVENSGLSQKAIADNIGVSRQAISQYCDGSTVPNADKLLKLAQFFNVSADYLLGLSETPTTNPEIKAICKYTGLTQESVKVLQYYRKIEEHDKDDYLEFMQKAILEGDFLAVPRNLLGTLNGLLNTKEFLDCLTALDRSQIYYNGIANSSDDANTKLVLFQQARFSHLDALEYFRKMVDSYLEEPRENAKNSIPDFITYEL